MVYEVLEAHKGAGPRPWGVNRGTQRDCPIPQQELGAERSEVHQAHCQEL